MINKVDKKFQEVNPSLIMNQTMKLLDHNKFLKFVYVLEFQNVPANLYQHGVTLTHNKCVF